MRTSRVFLMLLVAGTATAACEKNTLPDISGPPTGGAAVKFFNFSVGSPAVNFYVNDAKTTAVSSTACYNLVGVPDSVRTKCLSGGIESTTGVTYGNAANGSSAWYSDIAPGQVTIAAKMVSTDTSVNGKYNSTLATAITTGKFYSFYLSGAYNTTAKTTDSFIVEDVMPAQDFTVAYVRFVNASSNASPMTLWAKNTTTGDSVAIGGDVAYKAAGSFVAVPVASDTIFTRVAGTAARAYTRTSVVSFGAGRAYTVTFRGTVGTSSTLALDNTANR